MKKNKYKMESTFVHSKLTLNAFKADKIVFDESDLVSIDVSYKSTDQWKKTSLLFSFKQFNDLLRFSGKIGEKIQLLVSDKLLFAKEKPYIIFLEKETCVFSSCELKLCFLIADDISCYSVEEVLPISYLQQIKNLRKNISDYSDVHINNQHSIKNTLAEMASMYRYYIGLKELNLTDETARIKSGLQNEQLFKLAKIAAFNNQK